MNKDAMFKEHKYYMDYIVYSFLSKYPTFYYMKEDLQSECYVKFVELLNKWNKEDCTLVTYLGAHLPGYLHHRIRKEIILGVNTGRYKDEYGTAEETYEMGDNFSEILNNAGLTKRQEVTLRMKFEEDMSEQEVAEVLEVTQQAINRTLQRSYVKIRSTYEGL